VKPIDVKHLGKRILSQLREMRAFMRLVEKVAVENVAWPEKMTYASVNAMWQTVGPLIFQKYGKADQRRNTEQHWKTVYNQMSKKKAFA